MFVRHGGVQCCSPVLADHNIITPTGCTKQTTFGPLRQFMLVFSSFNKSLMVDTLPFSAASYSSRVDAVTSSSVGIFFWVQRGGRPETRDAFGWFRADPGSVTGFRFQAAVLPKVVMGIENLLPSSAACITLRWRFFQFSQDLEA